MKDFLNCKSRRTSKFLTKKQRFFFINSHKILIFSKEKNAINLEIPEKFLNRNFLQKIERNLTRISLEEALEKPKLSENVEKKPQPFSFTFNENVVIEENYQEKSVYNEEIEANFEFPTEKKEEEKIDILENFADNIEEKSVKSQKKEIQRDESINQKVLIFIVLFRKTLFFSLSY